MKSTLFIPIAMLAFAVACSENASTPVAPDGPLFAPGGGSPHFIGNATSCTQVGNNLVCSFKEAGLSSGSVETIQVSVFLTADYSCVNNGQNIPADPKKTTVSGTVTFSGVFTAGKNGQLIGSLTISPAAASTVLGCPPGQTATLISATYGSVAQPNAVITDLTSGATISVGGF